MEKTRPSCCLPWFQVDIRFTGYVQPCCMMGHIGNIHKEDILTIWNGKPYQWLRNKLASNDLKGTPCEACTHRLSGAWQTYPEFDFKVDKEREFNYKQAVENFINGDTVLTSKPVTYRMDVTNECNLRCKMCYQNHDPRTYETRFPQFFIEDFFNKGYYKHAGEVLLVGGEPLFVPESVEIIKRLSKIGPGECQLNLQTNGLLFDKYWEEIKTFKNAYFAISMDGCNAMTYEKIRRGGKWDNLLSILRKISHVTSSDKWRKWKVYHAHVVMRSNISELPQMLRFASDYDADIGFSPMYGTDFKDENIFIYNFLLEDILGWKETLDKSIEMANELCLNPMARDTLIFVRKLLLAEPWITRSKENLIRQSLGESGLQKIFHDKVKTIISHKTSQLKTFVPRHSLKVQFKDWISKFASAQNRLYYRDQTPESLNALVNFVHHYKPTKIIELGTLSGLSLRTWLSTETQAEIIAIDLSFKPLYESQKIVPVDLSRVKLLEQNALQTDYSQLWHPNDKVLFYFDAHDLPNVPIMRHFLSNAVPALPAGSVVIIDDLWYSPTTLTNDNARQFFENTVLNEIDPLQCFDGYYAPYWKGGSFFGFLEVIPLMEWANRNQISLIFEHGIKSVTFEWPLR